MTTDIGGIDVGHTHEPSYYEIALTNRQVVVAFVILLVCVVAAFLSGVWIGRESAVRAQEKMALLSQRTAGDAAEKEKTEGQALQEFKFFADPHHRPGLPGADAAAKPAAAAAEGGAQARSDSAAGAGDDAGRGLQAQAPPAPWTAPAATAAAAPATGKKAARAAHAAPSPTTQATPAAPDEPAGEGEGPGAADNVVRPRHLPDAPAPSAAASKRAAAASQTPAGAAPAAASADSGAVAGAAGDLVIQVFSSADREQADRVRSNLADAGFQAFLSPLAKNGQTMYRVRIGPFATRAAAEPVAEKVRKEQKLDTWITPK
jgi:SPOR domain